MTDLKFGDMRESVQQDIVGMYIGQTTEEGTDYPCLFFILRDHSGYGGDWTDTLVPLSEDWGTPCDP